jgi:arylsulfatase A-like enzyme
MDRRAFLHTAAGVGTAALTGGAAAAVDAVTAAVPQAAFSRPNQTAPVLETLADIAKPAGAGKIKNILFFMSDQQRQDCLGCYGHPFVQTPVADGLARNGVRFDNAFTPAAVCTPARACAQTGLLPHRHGLVFNSGSFSAANGGKDNLEPHLNLFAPSLKEKNFALAHIGKWHIGVDNRPEHYGYEGVYYPDYGFPDKHPHYLDYLKALGVDGFKIVDEVRPAAGLHGVARVYAGIQQGPAEATEAGYLASQTIDTLRRFAKSDRPFFIGCNFWGPHGPYYIDEKHYRMYAGRNVPVWKNFKYDMSAKPDVIRRYGDYWTSSRLSEAELSSLLAVYFGYISLIDDQMGRVMKALDELGLTDETLIVYSADHGATEGSHGMWDKGFGMYDCTQRIPLIISHPSLKGKAAVSKEYVTLMDLAPTFWETAGVQPPRRCDGRSLWPVIDDPARPREKDFIVLQHFGHQAAFGQRMVRTDTEKYIYNALDRDEFYDLGDDPDEMHNIIGRVPSGKLTEFRDRLREFITAAKDPIAFWSANTLYHG